MIKIVNQNGLSSTELKCDQCDNHQKLYISEMFDARPCGFDTLRDDLRLIGWGVTEAKDDLCPTCNHTYQTNSNMQAKYDEIAENSLKISTAVILGDELGDK